MGGLSYFYDGDANFQQKSHWTRAAECLKQKFQILLYSKQKVILVFTCVTPMAHEVQHFLNFG